MTPDTASTTLSGFGRNEGASARSKQRWVWVVPICEAHRIGFVSKCPTCEFERQQKSEITLVELYEMKRNLKSKEDVVKIKKNVLDELLKLAIGFKEEQHANTSTDDV